MMRAYIGASKSGKTYTMQTHVRAAARAGWSVAIVDLVEEWPRAGLLEGLEWSRTRDTASAMSTIVAGRSVTVLQPTDLDDDAVAHAVHEVCRAACRAPHGVIVAVPEAQVAFREHRRLDQWVSEIVHRYRHPRVNARLWVDTQMYADLSKRIVDACQTIHLFGGATRRDGGRVKELGGEHGKELVAAVGECGQLAARGQPGWHVRVTPLDARPPFRLQRA